MDKKRQKKNKNKNANIVTNFTGHYAIFLQMTVAIQTGEAGLSAL